MSSWVAAPAPQGYRSDLHRALVDRASARYRAAGRFAYGFARGKLGRDPLFIDLLRHGVLPREGRFLDLGCGQGVLASWLIAAQALAEAGGWPADWPLPPRVQALLGLELMPSDVVRAQRALCDEAPRIQIRQGDVTRESFIPCEVVTILDVLHYFDHERQREVLTRARDALLAGGAGRVLVIRVGDAAAGWRFELSRKVDQIVTWVRGHGWSSMYCRTVAEWRQLLETLGFTVTVIRSEGGPPFANTLLVAKPLDSQCMGTNREA